MSRTSGSCVPSTRGTPLAGQESRHGFRVRTPLTLNLFGRTHHHSAREPQERGKGTDPKARHRHFQPLECSQSKAQDQAADQSAGALHRAGTGKGKRFVLRGRIRRRDQEFQQARGAYGAPGGAHPPPSTSRQSTRPRWNLLYGPPPLRAVTAGTRQRHRTEGRAQEPSAS
jgi:hypothetical protein